MSRFLTTILIFWLVANTAAGIRAQAVVGPTTAPDDTLEAARVRIWVPVEQHGNCPVTVEIFGDSRQPVRRLANEQLPRGYYNFYWDKKNDSGVFLPAGRYQYVVTICGEKRSGYVAAEYLRGERECRVKVGADSRQPSLEIQLQRPAVLTLNIFDNRDRLIETPFTDSTWTAGEHHFVWAPANGVSYGRYRFVLRVDDFVQSLQLRYAP